MGTRIPFTRPDGKTAEGYLSLAGEANVPGVVVIQEWWGLQDQIKGLCDRFALLGYDALAPDLYAGTVVPYHDAEAAAREMQAVEPAAAVTGEDNLGAAQVAEVVLLAIPYANHAAILSEIGYFVM